MVEGRRRIFVLGAVFSGGLLAGVALAVFLLAKPEPVRDTSRLRDLLHSTAQQEIGLPPLADVEVELTIERGKLDEEIARIKALAARFGGTAIQGVGDESGMDVLAQISPKLTDRFLEALKHPEESAAVEPASSDQQNALVEVRLKYQSS